MNLKITGGIIAFVFVLFILSCESEEGIEFKRYYSSGALVYQTHCQNCHGSAGEGLAVLIPPLSDSVFLRKNKSALSCYIKNGLKGSIIIKGKTFDDVMPANDLTPVEIARVLTYIGNSFGNKLGTIDAQMIQADLGNCK